MSTKLYHVEVEVWVKPFFRKSRPKRVRAVYAVESINQLYAMLQKEYDGKRWGMQRCEEITGVTTRCTEEQ